MVGLAGNPGKGTDASRNCPLTRREVGALTPSSHTPGLKVAWEHSYPHPLPAMHHGYPRWGEDPRVSLSSHRTVPIAAGEIKAGQGLRTQAPQASATKFITYSAMYVYFFLGSKKVRAKLNPPSKHLKWK